MFWFLTDLKFEAVILPAVCINHDLVVACPLVSNSIFAACYLTNL